jgi:tetratricopeptide (TPR) repeat protein
MTSSDDGDQLPLGVFEGAPLLPMAESPRERAESDVLPPAYRELPVCGEWSYDTGDDSESRGGATAVELLSATTGLARGSAASRGPFAPPVEHLRPAAPGAAPGGAVTRNPARPAPPSSEPIRPRRPPMTPRLVPKVSGTPTPLPALDELRSQHEAHPGDAKTAIALAAALDKRGNIAAALGVLQRAIDAGAEAVPLRCARATILSGRLRYDDAEAELKRATKVHPDEPDLLLQLGILACRRAKWRDAVEPLARLVKLDGASAQAHFYLGEALNKLDRLQDALMAYETAAELDAGNWRALKGVGIVLDRMGRPADAAAYYRRARDAQSG